MTALSPRQSLKRLIVNDARNVRNLFASYWFHQVEHASLIADCAKRLLAAQDLGDTELVALAERNLRAALKGWRE